MQNPSWFVNDMDKITAEAVILEQYNENRGRRCFLVRNSRTHPDFPYTITMNSTPFGRIIHCRIRREGNGLLSCETLRKMDKPIIKAPDIFSLINALRENEYLTEDPYDPSLVRIPVEDIPKYYQCYPWEWSSNIICHPSFHKCTHLTLFILLSITNIIIGGKTCKMVIVWWLLSRNNMWKVIENTRRFFLQRHFLWAHSQCPSSNTFYDQWLQLLLLLLILIVNATSSQQP